MDIDFTPLHYMFQVKPLLVGGKAMEYYHLRKAGADIDFIVSAQDYASLAQRYPEHVKDLFGDMGVCVHGFELWNRIVLFEYEFLARGAVELETMKVISLEKLLFLKALAISEAKYEQDVRLIVAKILSIQYGKDETYDRGYFGR